MNDEDIGDLIANQAPTSEGVNSEQNDAQAVAAITQEVATPESNLPAKFAGKTAEEIANSYVDLERQFGKQGSEIGALKQQLDTVMMSQFNQGNSPAAEKEEVDFSYEPEKAVRQVVSDELAEIKAELAQSKAQGAMVAFAEKHPDYQTVGNDENFRSWVQESPYRVRQYNAADQNNDLDAADGLLSEWKDRQRFAQGQVAQQAAATAGEADNLSTLGLAVQTPVTNEPAKGPIFNREAIRDLKMKDPARYARLQPTIYKAYAEGRVQEGA